jgi:hypothetical protein
MEDEAPGGSINSPSSPRLSLHFFCIIRPVNHLSQATPYLSPPISDLPTLFNPNYYHTTSPTPPLNRKHGRQIYLTSSRTLAHRPRR